MSEEAETVLADALARLVTAHALSPSQADAVRTEFSAGLHDGSSAFPPNGSSSVLPDGAPTAPTAPDTTSADDSSWLSTVTEVGGYLGAALVFAAAVALVGPDWAGRPRGAQVALLAGPGIAVLLAAVAVASAWIGGSSIRDGGGSGPRRRLVGVLVLTGGGLLGSATAVITQNDDSVRAVPWVLFAVWGAGYLLIHGVLLHLSSALALGWAAVLALDPWSDSSTRVSGLMLVIVAVAWAVLAATSARGLIRERELGLAVAGALAFVGAESITLGDLKPLGYLLLAAIAAAGLAGYLRSHELTVLVVGAIALAVVVPQVVIDYTEGSLGTAGALLVSGLSIVAASTLGVRLRREAR